jgi:hypothetical protein
MSSPEAFEMDLFTRKYILYGKVKGRERYRRSSRAGYSNK